MRDAGERPDGGQGIERQSWDGQLDEGREGPDRFAGEAGGGDDSAEGGAQVSMRAAQLKAER